MLNQVVDEHIKQNKTNEGDELSVLLPPWMVGLMVFGGTDPATSFTVVKGAFEEGFSCATCRSTWETVGAAPITRKCLDYPQVQKTLGKGSKEYNVQLSNDFAMNKLTQAGFKGHLMKAQIIPKEDNFLVLSPIPKLMLI